MDAADSATSIQFAAKNDSSYLLPSSSSETDMEIFTPYLNDGIFEIGSSPELSGDRFVVENGLLVMDYGHHHSVLPLTLLDSDPEDNYNGQKDLFLFDSPLFLNDSKLFGLAESLPFVEDELLVEPFERKRFCQFDSIYNGITTTSSSSKTPESNTQSLSRKSSRLRKASTTKSQPRSKKIANLGTSPFDISKLPSLEDMIKDPKYALKKGNIGNTGTFINHIDYDQKKTKANTFINNDRYFSRLNLKELSMILELTNFDVSLTCDLENYILAILEHKCGFAVGEQTWIRGTSLETRERYIEDLYGYTEMLYPGISKKQLDIIVRRGSYYKMQHQLRNKRRRKEIESRKYG